MARPAQPRRPRLVTALRAPPVQLPCSLPCPAAALWSLAAFRVHNYLELFWMGMRYVLWHYAFGYMGLAASFRLYSFYVGIGATYIFTNFAVSHTHKDVVPKSKHISWTLYSANHTTNCSNHWFVNWWMAYLNFQIEHHLFPSMPQ